MKRALRGIGQILLGVIVLLLSPVLFSIFALWTLGGIALVLWEARP